MNIINNDKHFNINYLSGTFVALSEVPNLWVMVLRLMMALIAFRFI